MNQKEVVKPVRRRLFLLGVMVGLLVAAGWPPLPALAGDGKRIILIETMPVPAILETSRWFANEMNRLGYLPDEITIIESEGNKNLAVQRLKAAVRRGRPDVVVCMATLAAQAAKEVLDGSIPIVFAVVSAPVKAGLIRGINIPSGTNVTGLAFTLNRAVKVDLAMKLLEPKVGSKRRKIVFGVVHSDYPSAAAEVKAYQNLAATRSDVEFKSSQFKYRPLPQGLSSMLADYEKGMESLKGQIDYWWQVSGPLGEVDQATDLLLASTIPLAYGNTMSSVKAGALMTVNPNYRRCGQETARLAHAVLTGTKPGTIPVSIPDDFDLGINLSTALRLNLVVPSEMMIMAGPNVFR